MSPLPMKLLIDTNVWVDYYIDRGRFHAAAASLITLAVQNDIVLYCASSSLKDIFFIFSQEMKRMFRADGIEIGVGQAQAIQTAAWACVKNITELSLVVPVGLNEVYQAMVYRSIHGDFEDDLILAAAKSADVAFVVTSDEELRRHATVGCLGPAEMADLLYAELGLGAKRQTGRPNESRA